MAGIVIHARRGFAQSIRLPKIDASQVVPLSPSELIRLVTAL
jgi:hypothetical protein